MVREKDGGLIESEGGIGVFGMGLMKMGQFSVLWLGFFPEEDGFPFTALEGEVAVGDSELFAEVELCGDLAHLILSIIC